MKKNRSQIITWIPAVLWMLIIFVMSSRPRFGVTHEYVFDFLIFKSLHIFEYFILYVLVARAIYKSNNITFKKSLIYAACFSFLFAVSDEFHQTLVPTREGTIRDIFIDTFGITTGFLLLSNKLDFIVKRL